MSLVAPTYVIMARKCSSYSAPFDGAPGDVIGVFNKATNIGYSRIVGNIPALFFTLSQEDADALMTYNGTNQILGYGADTDAPIHFDVYRNGEHVWGGSGPSEIDETPTDVIVYAYGHAQSGMTTLSGWNAEYTDKTIKQIIDTEFTAMQAKTNSSVAWWTSGTIEAPVTTSGGATAITLPYYTMSYKPLLVLLREFAAFSASDTTNRVWFDVSPAGQLDFWKNKGGPLSTPIFKYPGGNVLTFQRYRMPVDSRTKIYAVGSSPNDVDLQTSKENTSLSGYHGLKEAAVYFQWVRDSTELDRGAARRLTLATKVDRQLVLTMAPNSIAPFDATNGLQMMYDYPVDISKGTVQYSGQMMVVGEQVIFTNGREYVRPIMQSVPV